MIYAFLVVGIALLTAIVLVLLQHNRVSAGEAAEKIKTFQERLAVPGIEKPENVLIDYDHYRMSSREQVFYIALAAVGLVFVSYVFYQSILFSVLLTPLAFFYPRLKSKELAEKRKFELTLQFKDALYSLSSSLSAGRSAETAFKEVLKDLAILYPSPETPIIREFKIIVNRIEMNEPVENALNDLARRSHIEDIKSFAEVFAIGKRSGGNMIEIMRNTSAIINDKTRIKEEIRTLLAERRFEQKVLNFMPVLMIFFLSWTTGSYMNAVFETAFGRFLMTLSAAMLAAAYLISQKIMDIEV